MKNDNREFIDAQFVRRYSEGEEVEPIFVEYYGDPNYEIVHSSFDGVYDTYELWKIHNVPTTTIIPPVPTPTRTIEPTPVPTRTEVPIPPVPPIPPKPTRTEEPKPTPIPTRTDRPIPTPVPTPTRTPNPTPVPTRTEVPIPPVPPFPPRPTRTERPWPTPIPTPVPTPTRTIEPTPDPVPPVTTDTGNKEPEPTPTPTPTITEEEIKEHLNDREYKEYLRIRRKYKSILPAECLALALLTLIMSGFEVTEEFRNYVETHTNIQPSYSITETIEEAIDGHQEIYGPDASIGGEYDISTGNAYFYGNYTGSNLMLYEGTYKITGFCINDKNGNYIDSLEDQDLNDKVDHYYADGTIDRSSSDQMIRQFTDFIEKVCTEKGLRYDEINISVQVNRIGWVDITNDLSYNIVDPQVKTTTNTTHVYDGTINDFEGDTISFTVNGKTVTVKVKDENGNYLTAGDKVIGSDGVEYTVDYIGVENTMEEKTESLGKHLHWRLSGPGLALAGAWVAAAILAEIYKQKKNREYQEHPQVRAFKDRTSYEAFLTQFRANLKEYHKRSGLFKKLKRFFIGETIEVAQDLTDEQVKQIYDAIRSINNDTYVYNPKDRIEFKDGQIIVYYPDGHFQNITDEVIPLIKDIGRDNPEIAEGLTDETYEEFTGYKPSDSGKRI